MTMVSDIKRTPPQEYKNELQKTAYSALQHLKIPFERIDTGNVITMQDCAVVDEKFNDRTVKTLFLCNRQQTEFYLFITAGDKPFSSKNFSAALKISRVSFAPAELMQKILGAEVGAATIFGALLESAKNVTVVLDKCVCDREYYVCSDGTINGYMKIKTQDVLQKLLPHTGCRTIVTEV